MNTIVDLNGDWELLWDEEDEGITNRWYATHPSTGEITQVPHIWERTFDKNLSDMDTAFYFKTFRIDEKSATKRLFLHFERVATHAIVWLNGKFLGEHFGAYTAFDLDASKAIKVGEENLLCLRVSNMGASNSRLDFGRESEEGAGDRYMHPYEAPVGDPWTQYPFGGIFGSVSLIIGNTAFISDVQLEPDTDQERVYVDISFSNPRGYQALLKVFMKNPAGEVSSLDKEIKLEKENASIRLTFGFKDWRREKVVWTQANPNLFSIELQLESLKGKKERSFTLKKNFGFRKFDCVNGDFYLNDSIIKIQGVTYTQHWSQGGIWTSANPALRQDLEAVKAAGFNAIRSGGAPLSGEALDICDELGLLVFQELPISNMRSSKRGLEMVTKLIKDSVLEQKHHPSIAAWVLGSENGMMMLENGTKLLKELDKYDITRPIISNLNCVYLDNEGRTRADTGKLMGITNDRTILYSSHRLHLRMNPGAGLCDFLAGTYCSKDEDAGEVSIPDATLGDDSFQDDYASFLEKVSGKILVTLKNHSMLPAELPEILGPRGVKNAKAVKAAFKQIDKFVQNEELSIWQTPEAFGADMYRLAQKSKLDQVTALQSNPLVAGFMLDQWADLGVDFSGLTDENRKSKGLEAFANALTKATRLLVTGLEHSVAANGEVQFSLSLLNHVRLKKITVTMEILNASGKAVASDSRNLEGTTSLTNFGLFTLLAPKTAGSYKLRCTLVSEGKQLDIVEEDLRVMAKSDIQGVSRKVCFLDNCSGTSEVLAALGGKEQVIFTANLGSWSDEILTQIVEVTKNGGKTLLLSDMTKEDIAFFNESHYFDYTLEPFYSTGSQESSIHYLPEGSPLREVFGHAVLDHLDSAVMPGVSLNALEGASVLARSVSLSQGELKPGVDLLILPFGSGKIIFNQFNIFEGLETNALADALFCKIVELA